MWLFGIYLDLDVGVVFGIVFYLDLDVGVVLGIVVYLFFVVLFFELVILFY